MTQEKKTRFLLFVYSVCVLVIVLAFVWVLNLRESEQLKIVYRQYMLVLGALATGALAVFFAFYDVFDANGQLATPRIIAMLLTILLVIQIAFAFATYTSKNMRFTFDIFSRARSIVDSIDRAKESQYDSVLLASRTQAFSHIAISDENGLVTHATDRSLLGQSRDAVAATQTFRLYEGGTLLVQASEAYQRRVTTDQLTNQITVLIVSLLFSVEFVLFAVKRVQRRQSEAGTRAMGGAAFMTVRQIAFLFYFALRLSSSFLTVLAKSLPSPFSDMDANVAAGLPQTADTFFTCLALLFTSRLLTRRGWRPPFLLGLGLIAAGTLLSAYASSLLLFIAARALVGLGYGFCWMTLRTLTLLGKDESARSWGFSMLNAGIYAGMICGSTIGSILAESLGYPTVLLISAGLLVVCGISICTMENQYLETSRPSTGSQSASRMDRKALWSFLAFVLLMIAPSCIVASFSNYFLPLFYQTIGRGVLEVGRAQLLYGLLIVYAGPYIASRIVSRTGSLVWANCAYNLFLAAGLIVLGLAGNLAASFATVLCLGMGDSFGFSAQNNYVLAQPFVGRIGESRTLSYLSLAKKLLEMAGPTVFALTMRVPSNRGILALGIAFGLATVLFACVRRACTIKTTEEVRA